MYKFQYRNLTLLLTQIYVWGHMLNKCFLVPHATSGFQHIDDVFSSGTACVAMWGSLNLGMYDVNTCIICMYVHLCS